MTTAPGVQHITTIEPRDSSGHFSWWCTCNAEADGYETAAKVVKVATAHGPLAADSLKPVDPPEDDEGPPPPLMPPPLPDLSVLFDFAHQLRINVDDVPADAIANPGRRQAVVAASLAAGFVRRVNDHLIAIDPQITPKQLTDLFTNSTLQAVDGDVDAAMALATVMFRWGTDTVKRLTQEDALDHLIEALALLISTYRDDGSPTTDEPKWIEEQTPDIRIVQALAHIVAAADELGDPS